MRVDGSVPSLVEGVTSLDDKQHSGAYSKEVMNCVLDYEGGLLKRPPFRFAYVVKNQWDELTHRYIPFTLQDDRYWFHVNENGMDLYDWFGAPVPVEIDPTSIDYLLATLTEKDLVTTAIDNALYIANRLVTIETNPTLDKRNKSSMIVVKQAPAPYSIINIQFTGSDGVIVNTDPFTTGTEEEDRGTNTVAEALAVLMRAKKPAADQVYVNGSTILYERADLDYANISASDGARDSVVATLNASTSDISNLGKYAGAECVVQIRPDPTSDRGSFWMRAVPSIQSEDPAGKAARANPDLSINVGDGDFLTIKHRGYDFYNSLGTQTPPIVEGTGYATYLLTQTSAESTPNQITTIAGQWGEVPVGQVDHAYIYDRTTGKIHSSPVEHLGFYTHTSGYRVTAYQMETSDTEMWEVGKDLDVYIGYNPDLFGKVPEVVWTEAADPTIPNSINANTMPHVLGMREDGTWAFGRTDSALGIKGVQQLRHRKAGNEDTNPMPSFVGETIDDIGKFQNRLQTISGENCVMSVTNAPHAWFRETVTQQLANDPIDIKSSSTDDKYFAYIVPHNKDSLIFSRHSQYKLNGSVGMTSANAAIPQTTAYENNPFVRPTSNGSDVYFVTSHGPEFSGVSRYQVDKQADTQDIAVSITQHVKKYIPGVIRYMDSSASANTMVCVASEELAKIYIYQHREDGKFRQSAWHEWDIQPIFPNHNVEIVGLRLTDFTLEVMLRVTNSVQMMQLMLDQDVQEGMPYMHYLDAYVITDNVDQAVLFRYQGDDSRMLIYEGNGCPNPGKLITGWARNPTTGVITLPYTLNGGSCINGFPYVSSFVPSRRWVRDDSGTPQTHSNLRITDYGFHARGDNIKAQIINAPSTWPIETYRNTMYDDDAYHRLSFKQRHDEADIRISSDDVRGFALLQLEWRGTYYKTGRRI